jgi:hypothetical protein
VHLSSDNRSSRAGVEILTAENDMYNGQSRSRRSTRRCTRTLWSSTTSNRVKAVRRLRSRFLMIKAKMSEEQRNSPEELGLKKNLLNFYGAGDDQNGEVIGSDKKLRVREPMDSGFDNGRDKQQKDSIFEGPRRRQGQRRADKVHEGGHGQQHSAQKRCGHVLRGVERESGGLRSQL